MPDRTETHGDFGTASAFCQSVKDLARAMPGWEKMEPYQREAFDLIAHKMQRALGGDPSFPDHWEDMGEYAKMVFRKLTTGYFHPPKAPSPRSTIITED